MLIEKHITLNYRSGQEAKVYTLKGIYLLRVCKTGKNSYRSIWKTPTQNTPKKENTHTRLLIPYTIASHHHNECILLPGEKHRWGKKIEKSGEKSKGQGSLYIHPVVLIIIISTSIKFLGSLIYTYICLLNKILNLFLVYMLCGLLEIGGKVGILTGNRDAVAAILPPRPYRGSANVWAPYVWANEPKQTALSRPHWKWTIVLLNCIMHSAAGAGEENGQRVDHWLKEQSGEGEYGAHSYGS